MKTCKVYKMMVYARSISQMNQKKLGSKKKLETFTNVQLNNFILGRPNVQNEYIRTPH